MCVIYYKRLSVTFTIYAIGFAKSNSDSENTDNQDEVSDIDTEYADDFELESEEEKVNELENEDDKSENLEEPKLVKNISKFTNYVKNVFSRNWSHSVVK